MGNRKNKRENKQRISGKNPYKGLFHYEEKDKELFYGRDTEKKRLFKLVEHNFLTVVFGKSGIGKTSLLNAGLFPKLRDNDFLPITLRLDYSSTASESASASEPAPDLLKQIRNIINSHIKKHDIYITGKEEGEENKKKTPSVQHEQPFGPGETLWEYFHRVNHWDDTGTRTITPVLVFDQFEEIFTLGKNNKAVDELINELYCLVENQVPDSVNEQMLNEEREFPYAGTHLDVRVVISLREDYLPDLNSLKSRFPSIDRVLFRIIHLNGKQAEEIIKVPGGIQEKNVINNILDLFQPEDDKKFPIEKLEIEPSLLSLLCFQLFEKQDVKSITKTDQDKILIDFYDSVLKKFPVRISKFIESKLLTEGGFRTPFYLEPGHKLRGSIDSLINERIIRKVYYGEKEHIEIIHDVLAPIIKEKRNRRVKRTKNVIIGILSVFLAVSIFITLYVIHLKNIAKRQLVNSLISEAGLVLPSDNVKAIRIAEAASNEEAYPKPPPHLMQVLIDAAASTYEHPFYKTNMQHTDDVNTVEFSPDGTKILTASQDKTAKLWDLKGRILKDFKYPFPVKSAIFSPDGAKILTVSADGTVKLWDLEGKPMAAFNPPTHAETMNNAVFSPDGTLLLTTSDDKTARLWDLHGQLLAEYTHTLPVHSARFSKDGEKIVTASSDNTAKVWNLRGELLADLKGEHKRAVLYAEFSPDGNKIVTASEDQTAKVWDWKETKVIADLMGHTAPVRQAIFSHKGTRILTCSNDYTARVWDLKGELLAELKGHTGAVLKAIFSPDGSEVLTCSEDKTAKLWDLKIKLVQDVVKHTAGIKSVAFSKDGTKILTASMDNTPKLWDLHGKVLADLKGHTSFVYSAEFSPDGTKIVTASRDKTVKLWDLHGKVLADLRGHTSFVLSAKFSPDGEKIVTASLDNTARVWDLKGRRLFDLNQHTDVVRAAAFSPDGKRIVTASSDKTAKVWDLKGALLADFTQHTDAVNSAVFSPDGTRILTASDDKTAKVWDLEGEINVDLNKHNDAVIKAVFSPDGTKILTASRDNTVKLWDLKGNLLVDFQQYTGTVSCAEFSHDGSRIMIASEEGKAKLWYTPEAIVEWLKTANIPQLSIEEKEKLGIEY
jgi:WD40 repeat protein